MSEAKDPRDLCPKCGKPIWGEGWNPANGDRFYSHVYVEDEDRCDREIIISAPSAQVEDQGVERVWRHLVKRMYDECGSTKADEFIRRVESGEHDVPSPWSAASLAPVQDGWISVDTSPQTPGEYLCSTNLVPHIIMYFEDEVWDGDLRGTDKVREQVTHWQPLPAAPLSSKETKS